MINTIRLRGLIAENCLSQAQVARKMGVVPQTFYKKMKKGDFLISEAVFLTDLLGIENPADIFFAQETH